MTNEQFELQLEAMAHGGRALGRHSGKTIFVPYTIPGERITAQITQDKGRIAFAEGLTLLDASVDRVLPHCPHFGPGRCGGCHWQHIDYAAQLLLKQDVLADQLERIGGFRDPDVRAVIPSPEQWHYLHHLTFERVADGSLGLPGTDGRPFAINECHILHPELLALKESLELDDVPGLQKVMFRIGSDGGRMLILNMKDDEAPELAADMPASVNLLLSDNEPVNLIGDSHSRYSVMGRSFRVTAGAAFRPNVAQLENLVQVVMKALNLNGSQNVLDLYAGVGLFTAFIAAHSRLVTLVESYPPAVTDADDNVTDFSNVDVIEGAVEDVLPALEDRYDAAVIDPPGDGLSGDALDDLVELAVPRLVYISGDPATLARDGKRLAAQGYRLTGIQPLDFAPQTYYIDTIAVFER